MALGFDADYSRHYKPVYDALQTMSRIRGKKEKMKRYYIAVLVLILATLACSPSEPVSKPYLPDGVRASEQSHSVMELFNASNKSIKDACLWDC